MAQDTFTPTARTTPLRMRERMHYDAATVHEILDEAYVCHVGVVVDAAPRVLPNLHVRVDDTLYLHGSTGGRLALAARTGAGEVPVCVAVTLLDGLVLARSQFHHSANYRSVVVHGAARLVTDEAERLRALWALAEKVATGRADGSRAPAPKELAQTALLALPLREAAARVRRGGVNDDPADLALPYWAGVVPLRTVRGRPEPADGLAVALPDHLREPRSPWLTAAGLRGRTVALEPLDQVHTGALTEVLPDVTDVPTGVAGLLDAAHAGTAVPWIQRELATDAVVGVTGYQLVDPDRRTVRIGPGWLGARWSAAPLRAESDLLLLSRAFDELGAVRVEWIVDAADHRARSAVGELGAVGESVLRRYLRSGSGRFRDAAVYALLDDEWPAARQRLAAAVQTG